MFQQPQQQQGTLDVRGSVNILYVLVSAHSTCFTVFLRRGFGSEALGFNAILALVLIHFYIMCNPTSGGMAQFLGLWFLFLILQRIKTFSLWRKGAVIHSRYDGYPWVGMMIPFLKTEERARFAETPICFIIGCLLIDYDSALSAFIAVGGISLAIKNSIDFSIDRRRLRHMRDAEIEQRFMVERYRGGQS